MVPHPAKTAMKPVRRRRPRHDAPLVDVAWPANARDLDCSGHSSGADSFDRSLRAAAAASQEKPPGRRPRMVVGLLLAQVAAVSTGVHYSREIRHLAAAVDRVGFLRYKLGKVSQRATVAALNDWNRDLGEVEKATGALEDVRAAAAAYEGALKAIHETGLEKLHAAEAVVVRALTHANEALARELDRRWHALLALLGAIEGCALVGCALYERRR